MTGGAYHELFKALYDAKVSYAIAGGFAAVLHGVPRMTFDLDLVVDPSDANMSLLVEALGNAGYRPRIPAPLTELANTARRKEWIDERNMIAFSLHHPNRPMEEVDIVLTVPMPWSVIEESAVRLELEGIPVVVVGKATLRKIKLATGREKDRVDAEMLGDDDE